MAEKEIFDIKEVISEISLEEKQTSTESLSCFPLYTKSYSQTNIEMNTFDYTWTINQFQCFSDTVPILRSAPFPESGQYMIQMNFPDQSDLSNTIKLYVLTKEAFTGLYNIAVMYPPETVLLSKTGKLGRISNMTLLLEIPMSKFCFHRNSDTHNSNQIHSNKPSVNNVHHNNDLFSSSSHKSTSSFNPCPLNSNSNTPAFGIDINSKSNSSAPAFGIDINSKSNSSAPAFGIDRNSKSNSSAPAFGIDINSKSNSSAPAFGIDINSKSNSSAPAFGIDINSKSYSSAPAFGIDRNSKSKSISNYNNDNIFGSSSHKNTFSFNIPINFTNSKSNSNAHNSYSLSNTMYNKLQCIISCKFEVYQQVLCNTLNMNLLPSSAALKLYENSTLDEFDFMNGKSIKFIVEKEQYVIQKKLLYATKSKYFKNICLAHKGIEKDMTSELKTNNEIEAFKQILLFIITGSHSVESYGYNTLKKLLITADKYNVLTLKLTCEHYLLRHIKIKNAVELMQLALLYNAKFLEMDSVKFIKFHMKEIVNTEEFKNLSQEDTNKIMELIEENQLEVSVQKSFFTANKK